jgi:CheY-like chemotaxis protein
MTAATNPGDFTLLVVDDVEENRDLLSRRLGRAGFKVVCADSGASALDALSTAAIDLVVLDVMMPGMSGIEVLRAVRADAAISSVPIIMATARTDSADVVEALDAGANDYVTKPIDFPVLSARISAALRTRRRSPSRTGLEIAPGAVLGQRYRLDAKIGEGGFGLVFRALHTELKKDVAIKVLHPSLSTGGLLGRFRLEGAHACRVQHPNALAVLDSGITDDGIAFLAMELLVGESLDAELAKGPIPFVRCAAILGPVCEALAAAHAVGIVHRDIKPANIYLHQGPNGEVPKVLDFGIAKLVGDFATDSRMTAEGSLIGTPSYMAPERFLDQPYDGRSDVYSIGVLLHQMICGQLPFGTPPKGGMVEAMAFALMHLDDPPVSLRMRDESIPEALDKLLMRTLAKNPENRPTAAELAKELLAAVDGVPPEASGSFAAPLLGQGSIPTTRGDVPHHVLARAVRKRDTDDSG